MSSRAVVVALAAAVAGLLVVGGGTSTSAFSGSVRNSADSVTIASTTCRAAELADGPSRMYSLAGSGGATNQGSAGAGTDATLVNNLLGIGFSSGGGCRHDPQSYFTTTPALAGVLARWAYTGGTTGITPSIALSQEVWVKTSTPTGLIMGFGDNQSTAGGSAQVRQQVFFTSTGRIEFATGQGGKVAELVTAGSYTDGTWHQVVAVYNGGTKQLYVDGQLRASGSGSGQPLSRAYWRLGNDSLAPWAGAPTGTNASYLAGGLQFAALYPKALNASQVLAHYRAGAA